MRTNEYLDEEDLFDESAQEENGTHSVPAALNCLLASSSQETHGSLQSVEQREVGNTR